MLGAIVGDEVAVRVVQGNGTLCDVVLVSWAMGIEPIEAVVHYAEGIIIDVAVAADGGADPPRA